MTVINTPQFTESVDLRYILEPLGGPGVPQRFLDRFPDELYNKAPDSHFMRFMATILGMAGAGWLQEEILRERLILEAQGFELVDLEGFFGDPFSFARAPREAYTIDISNLLPKANWDLTRVQDSSYRARAIEYVNAARLGTTPQGMKLAAQSGLGQQVEVSENYHALFDMHSDDRLGLPYFGLSTDLGEFIVRPRAAISRTQVQTISFDQSIVQGAFTLSLGGRNLDYTIAADSPYITQPLSSNSAAPEVQQALQALKNIPPSSVVVLGGPAPASLTVRFTGTLANSDLPLLIAKSDPNNPLVDATGTTQTVMVIPTSGAVNPAADFLGIPDADRHHAQVALDYLRPVASYPTFHPAKGLQSYQSWATVFGSSEYVEVIRYVTGSPSINWPDPDGTNWVEAAVEVEAPTTGDLQGHYVGFHTPTSINAYTDQAPGQVSLTALPLLLPLEIPGADPHLPQYNSVHVGAFTPQICALMPYFSQFNGTVTVFSAANALAQVSESVAITGYASEGTALIDRRYPVTYAGLQGVPSLDRQDNRFWASMERTDGTDYLDIDFGAPQAVNYISFEVTQKPVDIQISYDALDQTPEREFVSVVPDPDYLWDSAMFFDANHQSPWRYREFHFDDGLAMIFTRYIRIAFSRRVTSTPWLNFLYDPITQTQAPWSIDVRNLRVGRNVAPTLT